jgi:hypothetical protein
LTRALAEGAAIPKALVMETATGEATTTDLVAKPMTSTTPGVVWTSLARYLSGYQDRLLGGPLGLSDLRCTTPDGVKHKDYGGEVLG